MRLRAEVLRYRAALTCRDGIIKKSDCLNWCLLHPRNMYQGHQQTIILEYNVIRTCMAKRSSQVFSGRCGPKITWSRHKLSLLLQSRPHALAGKFVVAKSWLRGLFENTKDHPPSMSQICVLYAAKSWRCLKTSWVSNPTAARLRQWEQHLLPVSC